MEENTEYLGRSHLSTIYFTETEANPEYLGLDTSIMANFSNNTEYTLQLQASTTDNTMISTRP